MKELEQRLEGALAQASRMGIWLLFAVAGLGLVYWLAPQMVKVSLYKLSLLPAAVYVLYWIDRALNEKRPHAYFEEASALRADIEAQKMPPSARAANLERADRLEQLGHRRLDRRCWLICAGMIAVALGA